MTRVQDLKSLKVTLVGTEAERELCHRRAVTIAQETLHHYPNTFTWQTALAFAWKHLKSFPDHITDVPAHHVYPWRA